VFGQNSSEKNLLSLKQYRENLIKSISNGDSIKETRCKDKITEYIRLKKRYLQKVDSMDIVIKEKNNTGSGYYYYIIFTKPKVFNWNDCETEVINDGKTVSYRITVANHGLLDMIDSKFEIGKEAKFKIHNYWTSGQTYYIEDLKK
jgi:hypothetical protein